MFRSESRFMWREIIASIPASVFTSFGDRRRQTATLNRALISLIFSLISSEDSSSSATAKTAERGILHNSSNVSTILQEKPKEVKCSRKTCLEISQVSKMKQSPTEGGAALSYSSYPFSSDYGVRKPQVG